jgi:hypothetical protein
MNDKRKVVDDLMDKLNDMNCNKVNADNGMDELFGEDKLFSVVCNKCKSSNIEIIGERGFDYGGETGYQTGSTVVKCNDCGSALTVWESCL